MASGTMKTENITILDNISGNVADWSANSVGSWIDSHITRTAPFIGYFNRSGRCFITGYHYMQSGNHYFTALAIGFGVFHVYSGINGTYSLIV